MVETVGERLEEIHSDLPSETYHRKRDARVLSLSNSLTPKKSKSEFRNYENSDRQAVVMKHYQDMRSKQTLAQVDKMYSKWMKFGRRSMTIREAFVALEEYVDSSDPDTGLPNIIHAFQTAEAIRASGHPDWFQLVGLLHDLGKMQFLWGESEDGQQGTADGPQWALGGDTWVVGCRIPDSCVFPQFNELNPDMRDERYNTKMGVYEAGSGLMDNAKFAWGHDEYMYQLLKFNGTTIPEEGLAMIRLHSCYPWHQQNEYEWLMNEKDHDLKEWVLEFNKFDLYTKANDLPDIEAMWPYYQGLIDKYCPGKLVW